tara:strand:- start:1721 stop:1978 length:258 start_codon:yes stop_codon:yes gene_type:complete
MSLSSNHLFLIALLALAGAITLAILGIDSTLTATLTGFVGLILAGGVFKSNSEKKVVEDKAMKAMEETSMVKLDMKKLKKMLDEK